MEFIISSLQLPVRLRPDTPMSDDDLLRFCAANKALKIEREPDGELSIMTPAGMTTFVMNERMTRTLSNWAEVDGRGAAAGPDAGYALPDGSVRTPDASWYSFEKANCLTEEEKEKFPAMCPEFIVELSSPEDRTGPLIVPA